MAAKQPGKVCTKCGEWKVLEAFHRARKAKDGRKSSCKVCRCMTSKVHYGARRLSRPEQKDLPAGKVCIKCGQWKVLGKFCRRWDARDGRRGECRECGNAMSRVSYGAHRERNIARNKAYSQAHPEKSRARQQTYRKAHPERLAARLKAWREANTDKRRAYQKAWYEAHPKKGVIYARRRRARKHNASGSHSAEEWQALLSQYDTCPCCGRSWTECGAPTRDHVIPLTWEGATDDISNLQPLCHACNSGKRNHHATDYRYKNVTPWDAGLCVLYAAYVQGVSLVAGDVSAPSEADAGTAIQ